MVSRAVIVLVAAVAVFGLLCLVIFNGLTCGGTGC